MPAPRASLDAEQHAQLAQTLLGTLTDSASPEELAANWQRVAEHFDLLLDRPENVDALEQTLLQLAVRGLLNAAGPERRRPPACCFQKIRAEKDRPMPRARSSGTSRWRRLRTRKNRLSCRRGGSVWFG